MKTNIKFTNIPNTVEVSEYLNRKLSSLDKLVDPNDDANICYIEVGKTTEHHKTGDIFKAEITCHIGGKSLRAESYKSDIHAAIDEMKDEMYIELRKNKTKHLSLIRRGGLRIKNALKGVASWPSSAVSFSRSKVSRLGKYFKRSRQDKNL